MSNWGREYENRSGFFNDALDVGQGPANPPRQAGFNLDEDIDVAMQPAGAVAPPRRLVENTEEVEQTPLQTMIRHWMNERHSPDILPAQEALLAGLLDHLRSQTRNIQILRDDPRTSESEHIRIMLVQTEIERVKFLIRSYIRTRLYKIERYARFITTNADIQTRLTASEREHASRHAKITDQHLFLSVLQSLPESQAHLDDTPVFYPSMVTQPDKTRPVFVHALQDCPPVALPDGTRLQMNKGHISLTPYHVVEHLVARGEAELV
ncbi:GINS complex, Sld5 component [Coprinopsis marcescibilis]|uniref:DNA replication complex GINS protein SLD5 n=1 Tax=Coprinopsis marcescibilis TaxID=230819 RepID=A0A5C3KPA7_COPMA|nr:GINS complex, Sld5 component [Coprinopsis marcescibilis]